jgi:DNA topoisomerase-3
VQTPALALVVNRCLAAEQFAAKDFFTVAAEISLPQGAFTAFWKPGDGVPADGEGRAIDRRHADAVRTWAEGQPAQVTHCEASEREQAPPLPYSLSALQQAANKLHGLGAQAVLDAAQALYEAKATSYPRTDCPYLPESQWADARRVIAGLPADYAALADQAGLSRRPRAYDDRKVTAHHAIVPTGQPPGRLDERQRLVYDLVVRAYLAQFFPPSRRRDTRIVLGLAGETFEAAGTTPLEPGWKAVYAGQVSNGDGMDAGNGENPEAGTSQSDAGNPGRPLPTAEPGDTGVCQRAETLGKKTTPPAHFTEGTLIAAMTRVHLLVDDPELKKRLKETAGIGTEATRADIIETLKKRGFIAEKGRTLRDTPAGRALIQLLPEPVKSPAITGLFEQLLKGVEEGTVTPERFMAQQTAFVEKYVLHAKESSPAPAATPDDAQAPACPSADKAACAGSKAGKAFSGAVRATKAAAATPGSRTGPGSPTWTGMPQ